MENTLYDFLMFLYNKGLINDHDFGYEEEAKEFASMIEPKPSFVLERAGRMSLAAGLVIRSDVQSLSKNISLLKEAVDEYDSMIFERLNK